MQIRFIPTDAHASPQTLDPGQFGVSLTRDDGFTWVDIPDWDAAAEALQTGHIPLHPRVVESFRTRNHLPTVHRYPGQLFLVLHSPLLGPAGHVHLLELDLVVGQNYLITTHGPISPDLDPAKALVETEAGTARIIGGRLRDRSPMGTAYAVCSAVARRQRELVGEVGEKLPGLEQDVMRSRLRDPESLIGQLFLVRHELITARTMSAQTHDIFARAAGLRPEHPELADLADQFDRVRSIADGEAQFLFGVTELYKTKVDTKMTVAMERLAVIAAITCRSPPSPRSTG